MDLLASLATLTGTTDTSTDSEDLLKTLLGTSNKGRDNLVLEATGKTALRSGDWVYIPDYKGKNFREKVGIEVGNFPFVQLYNVTKDKGQQNNLAESNPEKLSEMKAIFGKLRGLDYTKGVKEVQFR